MLNREQPNRGRPIDSGESTQGRNFRNLENLMGAQWTKILPKSVTIVCNVGLDKRLKISQQMFKPERKKKYYKNSSMTRD